VTTYANVTGEGKSKKFEECWSRFKGRTRKKGDQGRLEMTLTRCREGFTVVLRCSRGDAPSFRVGKKGDK